jgi:adenylate cyclase
VSFFTELQRRNVVRVGVAYTLIAWVIAQVAEFAFESFGAPDWTIKSVVVLLLLGLPLALIFAWVYEMTPEGIKKEKNVDRSTSITPATGRRLDRVIIAVLVVALAFFAFDKYARTPAPAETASRAVTEEAKEPAPVAADSSTSAPKNSVAVLPFVAMSSGPDDEYFADGLTEEILNSLAQLPELLVTARTSAFVFKGDDLPPIPEIAEKLGVRHIVEGSVRRSGERLRVTAQLIRAGDGFHLWSNNYDSTAADTIRVQENIAERIAIALDVALDEEKSAAMRNAGLRDAEAFTLYQKGVHLFEQAHGEVETIAGLRAANEYFDQVIERVPEFGVIYQYRADLWTHMLNNDLQGGPDERFTAEEAAEAYSKAVADFRAAARYIKNPDGRLQAEIDLAYVAGNWRGLVARTERLLASDNCTDGNWAPTIANVVGLAEQHRRQSEHILACDPLRSLNWFNLARATLWTGNSEEAVRIAREGMEIAPGAWLEWIYAQALTESGRYEEAGNFIDTVMSRQGFARAARVLLAAKQGDRAAAQRAIADGYDNIEERFLALAIYAWTGQRDDANRLAARYDEHPWGPWQLWQIAHWCACGAPWDLEATPNFARRLEVNEIPWPPASVSEYPLKSW